MYILISFIIQKHLYSANIFAVSKVRKLVIYYKDARNIITSLMDSESSIMIPKLTSNMDYDNQLNRFGESKLENRSISFLNFMCVLRQKLVVLFYKNLGYNNCYI